MSYELCNVSARAVRKDCVEALLYPRCTITVVADDHRGNTLGQVVSHQRCVWRNQIRSRMRVNIDKTRCDDLPGNINNGVSPGIVTIRQHQQSSVPDTDVAFVRRCASAIDHQSAFEQDVDWPVIDYRIC